MSDEKTKNPKGEKPAEKPAEAAPESVQPEPVKNWQYWLTRLQADSALARGACAAIKADWESVISEEKFKAALKEFGTKKF